MKCTSKQRDLIANLIYKKTGSFTALKTFGSWAHNEEVHDVTIDWLLTAKPDDMPKILNDDGDFDPKKLTELLIATYGD